MRTKRTDERTTRRIAPRLASGDSREKDHGRLPPAILEGLRAIALDEGKSVNWVREEIIIDYFKLRRIMQRLSPRVLAKLYKPRPKLTLVKTERKRA